MAAQVTIDIRSFFIGTIVGIVILAAIGLWRWDWQKWGESLSWGELGALPGLFFLLLGASRVCRHCSSSEVLQTP